MAIIFTGKKRDTDSKRKKPLERAGEDTYQASETLADYRANANRGETLGDYLRRRAGTPSYRGNNPATQNNPFLGYSNVLGIDRATSGGLGRMQTAPKTARENEYETNTLLNEFYDNYSAVDDSRKNELKQANWNAGSRLSERADIANRAEEDLLGYAMTNWDSDTSDAGYTRRLQEAKHARYQAAQALRESALAQRELDTARNAEWFNERTEYYNSLRSNPDFLANSVRVFSPDGREYNNETTNYERDVYGVQTDEIDDEIYDFNELPDEYKRIWRYLYNTQGKKAADDYWDYLKYGLDYAEAQIQSAENAQFAREDPVAADIATTATKPAMGVAAAGDLFAQRLMQTFTGRPINAYNNIQRGRNVTSDVRETQGQDLNEVSGTLPVGIPVVGGKGLGDVYQFGMSQIDSMINNYMTMGASSYLENLPKLQRFISYAGTSVMGADAMAQGFQEAKETGASDEDAFAFALAQGVNEALFEHVSLENLMAEKDAMKRGQLILEVLKQGGVEASEEVATTVANTIADAVINTDRSEYERDVREYLQNHPEATEEDARQYATQKWINEIGSDALGGFFGGLLAGGAQSVADYYQTGQTGQQMRNNRSDINARQAVRIGMQMSTDSEAYQLASEINDKGIYKASNVELGRLQQYVDNELYRLGMIDNEGNTDERYDALMGEVNSQIETEDIMRRAAEEMHDTYRYGAEATDETSTEESPTQNEIVAERTDSRSMEEKQAAVRNILNTDNNVLANNALAVRTENGTKFISDIDTDNETVTLSDGTKMSVDDVKNNSDLSALLADAEDLPSFGARAMLRNYKGGNVAEYANAFRQVAEYGRLGNDYADIINSEAGQQLNAETRQIAYAVGNRMRVQDTMTAKSQGGVVRNFRRAITRSENHMLNVIDRVFRVLGRTVEIVDEIATVDKNGKVNRSGANAEFNRDTNTYRIAIDSVNRAFLHYAVHESIHDIALQSEKSRQGNTPTDYDIIRDAVIKHLEANGQSLESLLETQRKNHGDNTDEYYIEEIVANTVPAILSDEATLREFADRFVADNRTKNAFGRLVDAIIKYVHKLHTMMSSNSDWQQMASLNEDQLRDIREKYFTALENIRDNSTTKEQAVETLNEAGFGADIETGTVYSLKYSTEDENLANVSRSDLISRIQLITNRSAEDVERFLKAEETVALAVKDTFLDFTGNDKEVAIKKNSDYPQGTIDLTNICPKRIGVTQVTNRLQEALPNDLFTADDYADIRLIMMDDGRVVACGLCFVEDRRQKLGEIAQEFIREWNSALKEGRTLTKVNAAGQTKQVSISKDVAKRYGVKPGAVTVTRKNMRQDTFISSNNWYALQKNDPYLAAAFEAYNNSRGQNAGRLLADRAEYKREILTWDADQVKAVNDVGGLRIFSFSDFEVVHLMDLLQIIEDCAAMGVKIQGYTKQTAFAKLVSNTGIKLNRSFIPYGATGLRTVNGKRVLVTDTKEGIDTTSPYFLNEAKNPNVGNNITGINDEQIHVAMLDNYFHYIIPFHSNKAQDSNNKLGVGNWKNYKEYQRDKAGTAGDIRRVALATQEYKNQGMSDTDAFDKAVAELTKETKRKFKATQDINIYTEVLNDPSIKTERQFTERFLEVCREKNIVPRFAQFLDVNEQGDYVYTPGYSKFLVDFKTFDYETGEYLPQQNIVPDFDAEYVKELIAEELKKDERQRNGEDYPEDLYQSILNYIKVKHGHRGNQKSYQKYANIVAEQAAKTNRDVNGTGSVALSPSTRLSAKTDSTGATLTEAQQRYFADSKVVDDQGRLLRVYHGTDSDFFEFKPTEFGGANGTAEGFGIYLAANREISERYGNRVIEGYANITKPATSFRKTIRQNDLVKLIRTLCEQEAQRFVDDGDYSSVKEALRDTWISNYTYTYDKSIDASYRDVAQQILDMNDNDMDIIQEIMAGMAVRNYGAAYDFYDALTRTLGFDGFMTYWTNDENQTREPIYLAFNSNQVKLTTNTNPTSNADMRYSPKPVDPVEPTSSTWRRTIDTEEAMRRFPNLWNVTAEESETRNPTQIKSTVGTYRKIYNLLKADGFNGTILDASSGLGYGTRAGIEEFGFDVEDIEPYPDKSYKPKYTDYSKLNKQYDVIISNAVLNVIPQDQRDALVVKMGEMLAPGGKMYVNVRGNDVDTLASNPDNVKIGTREWYVASTGSYQKGFSSVELQAYLKDALGDGFTIERSNKFGGVAAIVTKNSGTRFSEKNMTFDNDTAYVKQDTLDYWMSANGFGASNPNYAQAFITRMSPDEFLSLTANRNYRSVLENESRELDVEELRRENRRSPIFLDIHTDTGEVWGHEGRHRMIALRNAGIKSVPVLLFDMHNKYSKQTLENYTLTGQTSEKNRVTVADAIPLNNAHRQEIEDRFTAKDDNSLRFSSKTGTNTRTAFREETDDFGFATLYYEHDPIFERYDNPNGWVDANGLLTKKEWKLFASEMENFKDWRYIDHPKARDGGHILETRNKLVYWDGNVETPAITKIIRITSGFDSVRAEIKECLYEYESGSASLKESQKTIKNLFGSKVVRTATSAINERDGWENRRRERKNSSTFDQTDREWRDNERVTRDGAENAPFSNAKKYSEKIDPEIERIKAKRRTNKQDRIKLRDAGEKLSENDFYSLYSAHKLDLRRRGNVDEQVESIKRDGFRGDAGFGHNIVPSSINNISRYTEQERRDSLKEYGLSDEMIDESIRNQRENPGPGIWLDDVYFPQVNATAMRYGGRKGDTVLFVPEHFTEHDGANVRNGFKPFDYEVVKVERDFQPYYELYSKAYDEWNSTRYSAKTDSAGRELSAGQQRYFADSKVVDDQGRLKVMYHGTRNAGFTVFDPSYSDDRTSLFFTDDPAVAATYAGGVDDFRDPAVPMTVDELNTAAEYFGLGVVERNGKYIIAEADDGGIGDDIGTFDTIQEAQNALMDYANKQDASYPTNYQVYLNITNPLVVDAKGATWNMVQNGDAQRFVSERASIGDYVFATEEDRQEFDEKHDLTALERAYNEATKNGEAEYRGEVLDEWELDDMWSSALYESERDYLRYYENHASVVPISEFFEHYKDYGWYDLYSVIHSYDRNAASLQELMDGGTYEEMARSFRETWEQEYEENHDDGETLDEWNDFQVRLIPKSGDEGQVRDLHNTRWFAQKAKREGYDGVIFTNIYDSIWGAMNSNVAIAFKSDQVKSIYNENPSANEDYRYSEKAEPSNRELLANALLSITENAKERESLENYKRLLGNLNSMQDRLDAVNRKIYDIMQKKVKAETGEMKRLQDTSKELTEQLQKYDKKLLNLESTSVLKKVLEREKRKAFSKGRAEGRVAERERVDESVQKNKFRNRIQKNVNNIYTWMAKPTDTKHVPEPIRNAVGNFIKSIDLSRTSKAGTAWRTRMDNLATQLQNGNIMREYEAFAMDLDPELALRMREFVNKNNKAIMEMSVSELQDLSQIVSALKKAITEANWMHGSIQRQYVSEVADMSMQDFEKARKFNQSKKGRALNKIVDYNQMDAYSFFKSLGDGGMLIYNDLREGFDNFVRRSREVVQFQNSVKDMLPKKALLKKHTLDINGEKVEMTTGQIMTLYELNKREQAKIHLYNGGMFLKTDANDAYSLTPELVDSITSNLTEQEKAYADRLQNFLGNVCAAWGNEASMLMYGYRKFTDEHYFPINTAGGTVQTMNNVGDAPSDNVNMYRIANLGMTKALQANAKNPIIVESIETVFGRHASEMAEYSSYLAPLSDAMKWFNAKTGENGRRVSYYMQMAFQRKNSNGTYSDPATQWFKNFIAELNGGGTRNGAGSELWQKILGHTKAAAVGANLSVVVQQVWAYFRAYAEVDAKYMAQAFRKKPQMKLAWQYCPIAQWKHWGMFESMVSKNIEDMMSGKTSVMNQIRDKLMWLAGAADDVTWGWIWNACEAEMMDKHPNMDHTSEEFREMVGKRMSEVIDSTQVVDSIFHRPMALKNKAIQTLTAFMAEPMKSYNVLQRAVTGVAKGEQGSAKRLRNTLIGWGTAQILAAVFQSLVGAMRDDDDDETFMEKWGQKIFGEKTDGNAVQRVMGRLKSSNLFDNLNPLGMHWITKYVWQGLEEILSKGSYSSTGIDDQLISKAKRTLQTWQKLADPEKRDEVKTQDIVLRTADIISTLTGVGAYNAIRDVWKLYNNITHRAETPFFEQVEQDMANGDLTSIEEVVAEKTAEKMKKYPGLSAEKAEEEARSDVRGDFTENYKPMYVSAWFAGDDAETKRIYNILLKSGLYGSQKDLENDLFRYANSWIINEIKERYKTTTDENERRELRELLKRCGKSTKEIKELVEKWVG